MLASLSPVMLRAFGVELGPALPVEPVAMARAREPGVAGSIVDLAARSPVIAGAERSAGRHSPPLEPEIVIFDDAASQGMRDETADPDEDVDAAEELGADQAVAVAEHTDAMTEPTPRAVARPDARPTELAEAKAACRRGNKDAARSLYRGLPVGDARRREIRRACRQEGVWIL